MTEGKKLFENNENKGEEEIVTSINFSSFPIMFSKGFFPWVI